MAHQNLRQLCVSMDRQEFFASFIEACEEEEKIPQFDLKYSVSQTQELVQHDLKMAALENPSLSSAPSSSFHLLLEIITDLGAKCGHGGSEQQDLPQVWKDPIDMTFPLLVTKKELSKASPGSKSKESESGPGGHGEPTEDDNAAITNSNHSFLSSALSLSNNSRNPGDTLRDLLVLSEISDNQQVNPPLPYGICWTRDSFITIDMPMNIPSESSLRDDTKLGFTVFAVELLGALSNLAASPKANEHQLLIYAVVISSTFAFLLSSTAFLLHKKRAVPAKTMQKAAFLFGAFGFLGIIGIFLPARIMWWFTISVFLVFLFMFAIATYVS